MQDWLCDPANATQWSVETFLVHASGVRTARLLPNSSTPLVAVTQSLSPPTDCVSQRVGGRPLSFNADNAREQDDGEKGLVRTPWGPWQGYRRFVDNSSNQ